MDFKTIFDGWGTMLIGIILGGGGVSSLWYYKHTKIKQIQTAGDKASQIQVGRDFKDGK
jgi:hypothetical protein